MKRDDNYRFYSSAVYDNTIWSPVFFPIKGRCDTYGALEPDKKHINFQKLQKFNPNLTKNDFKFSAKDENQNNLMWFVLEDVYQEVCKYGKIRAKTRIIKSAHKTKTLYRESFNDTLSVKQTVKKLIQSEQTEFGRMLRDWQFIRISLNPEHSITEVKGYLHQVLSLEDDEFTWFIDEYIKLKEFRWGMHKIRRAFMPNTSVGSQHEDYCYLGKFDYFLSKRVRTLKKKWANEDYD